jgi:hypothetical protein
MIGPSAGPVEREVQVSLVSQTLSWVLPTTGGGQSPEAQDVRKLDQTVHVAHGSTTGSKTGLHKTVSELYIRSSHETSTYRAKETL